ncbi:MAG: ribosomal RNA small subunit methyltransferase A [Candidatus Hecatellales archaeon ex4484_218]|nr:MAG: ribosomal RNA small subunit methyltransferase A [Candidatus Hecatellales archaeon ex4484_218]
MSLLNSVKKLLRIYSLKPKKIFGQSFVVDEALLEKMANYANLTGKDTVLEIGAGFGFLTEVLASKAGKVLAVEVDPKLVKILRKKFSKNSKVKIFHGDFLKLDFKGYYNKVVSSPPYSTISKIIFKLLEESFDVAILLLQKEFALRLLAKPGEKDYGRLTVMAYVKSEVEVLEEVPSIAFYPKPKVSSILVKIKPKKEPPFKVNDWKIFEETVRLLFTQKNRKLRNALKIFLKHKNFGWLNVDDFKDFPYLERRIFTLKPEEICEISNLIVNLKT